MDVTGRDPPTYPSHVILTTLGNVSLALQPEPPGVAPTVAFGAGKPAALVAYLACAGGRAASREHLIDLLWSDLDRRAGQHALRVTVSRLKGAIGQHITASGDTLVLDDAVHSDRDDFLTAVDRSDLEAAVALYTGDFFPDFATPGTAPFEHWADREREYLRATFVRCADVLVRMWLGTSRMRDATELAQRVRDLDPLRQAGWRLLLETLIASQERLRAAITADALERLLADEELILEPATRSLVRAARHTGPGEQETGGVQGLAAELVGREREFAAIVNAWDGSRAGKYARVHVTAPAGMGKTRLLADVHARLRAMQARVVSVRGNHGARGISGALAGDLALALAELPGALAVSPGVAGALVALNPTLSSCYSAPPDRAEGDDALRRRAIAIRELITVVAYEAPVAILIDDLQWADGASRTLLDGVLGDLDGHPVLVVCAARPHGLEQRAPGDAIELSLAPLSPVDVGAIVASLGDLPDTDWAAALPHALHQATGGSPLLVLETLQLALDQGLLRRDGSDWSAPDAEGLAVLLHAGGAIHRRLVAAQEETGALLVALAVSGMPLAVDTLARATGMDGEHPRLLDQLAMLERRGLAVHADARWQLAHDEHMAGVLDMAEPAAVRAAHAALGRALFWDAGNDVPCMRRAARHLRGGGEHELLRALFARFVQRARSGGDQRSNRALALDFLGGSADTPAAARLVKALPWRLRARLATRRRIAAATVAITLASAGIAAAVAAIRQPPPPPPDALLVVAHSDTAGGRLLLHDFPLRRAEWRSNEMIELQVDGAPHWRLPPVAADWNVDEVTQGYPGTGWWTGSRAVADSGVIDIFNFGPRGEIRRLTALPADEADPQWAPDGSQLAFRAGGFHPLRHADIAVLDAATDSVRQLTSGDETDGSPRWSPDGTRIAFSRWYWDGRPATMCVVAVDGGGLRCLGSDTMTMGGTLGWSDERHVLVSANLRNGSSAALARVDLETGEYAVLDSTTGRRSVSPDGQWVACECRRAGYPADTWFVHPTDRPDAARPVRVTGVAGRWRIVWARAATAPRYLDSLQIEAGVGEPIRGLPHQLRVSGLDPSGAPVRATMVRWRSLDTLVATVDPTGLLTPRRAGRMTVAVSAGGWRSTSRTFTIRDVVARTVLVEDWRNGIGREWMAFGQPHPSIVQDDNGAPALWNGNGGTYTSGVYSRSSYSPADGIGLEVRLSTPVTLQQWQMQSVGLYFGTDSSALASWDHRTGYSPITGGHWVASCGANYPGGGEGQGFASVISTSFRGAGPIPAPPDLRTGRWFTLRVQLFPDGRCGIAIDGRPVALGLPQDLAGTTARVMIDGQSYRTRILAGRVELFTGVRTDVDWSALLGATSTKVAGTDR